MAVSGIAFTMYPVTDMERALAFYRDELGLTSGEIASGFWHEFEIAGGTFGIGNFEQVGTPGTASSLALEVADIHAEHRRLTERGIDISAPHDLGGCWISGVKDPDGNGIWLHQKKR